MYQSRELIEDLATSLFKSKSRKKLDFDQAILRRVVWPYAVKDSLQHDSYFCQVPKFNLYHKVRPFPSKRLPDNIYVGWSSVRGSNGTGITPCPVQCRRKKLGDTADC